MNEGSAASSPEMPPSLKSADVAADKLRRFKPYRKYRDSGLAWPKQIPTDWEVKRLKLSCHMEMGQSPPSDSYNESGIGLPFLQGNADFGVESPNPRVYCPSPAKVAKAGDLLLSVRAPVGAINTADRRYGIGRGLCSLTPDRNCFESTYFRFVMETCRWQLDLVATGSTYVAVAIDDVGNIVIPIPKIKNQRAIAEFLCDETAKIDALIEKKQHLIELLQEKRTALITHAVTKGLDPNVPMKDSGVEWMGEIPAHWEIAPVYSRFEVALGKMLDSKKITEEYRRPYLRNVDVQWDYINVENLPEMSFPPSEVERYALRIGDLLVCEGGEVGRSAIWKGELAECCYQKAVHRVRPITETDNARFLFYIMHTAVKSGVFLASGNPNTIAHLTAIQLKRNRFPFPNKKEQHAITQYLDQESSKIDQLSNKVQRGIEKLQEFRTALISAAVTGKIDVRDEVSPGELEA